MKKERGSYKKSNLTKHVLSMALKSKLKEKELDQITVTELTDLCGLNRQTFYYHFGDLYELFEWTMDLELMRFYTDFDLKKFAEQTFVDAFLETLYENKNAILNIYGSLEHIRLRRYFFQAFYPLIENHLAGVLKKDEKRDGNFVFMVNFFTDGLTALFLNWFGNAMQEDLSPDLKRFYYLIESQAEPDW
jgi:AcrR family transcriptional regulator